MKNFKISISYASWGTNYYNNLLLSLKTIFSDLILLESNFKHEIYLDLYVDISSKNKLFKNDFFNEITNLFSKVNFFSIDEIIKNNNKNNIRINLVQQTILKNSQNYDFLGLFYPDFLFSKNTLINHIREIEKGSELILSPVICINHEHVNEDIINILNNENSLIHEKFSKIIINNIHNIQKYFIFNRDENKFPLSPAWLAIKTKKGNLYFRCFHNTPIFFKTSSINTKKLFIEKAIDEDFIEVIYRNINENNIYFSSKSSLSLIASTKSINDPPNDEIVKKLQGDFSKASEWVLNNVNDFHKLSSKYGYLLEINGKEDITGEKKFLDKIISKLLTKKFYTKIKSYFKFN
tara:strand:- start:280 stop:1329 length:1050 start_codon:yes stop_codon:yes gene_type:complete